MPAPGRRRRRCRRTRRGDGAFEPADVGALAVAVLGLDFGVEVVHDLVVVHVVLFGEAEVDERAVPCVAERHCRAFRGSGRNSFDKRYPLMATEIPLKLPLPEAFDIDVGGQRIAGEDGGQGPPIVQLHGLTATRRYVTMGSRLLQRRGYRQIGYDARGHGESGAAPSGAYEYADLGRRPGGSARPSGAGPGDPGGQLDGRGHGPGFRARAPGAGGALVQLTPAFEGAAYEEAEGLAWWDSLADGLERGGVEGFMEAYAPMIKGRFAESIERLTRQRLERHLDPVELAKAVRAVPRSIAFDGLERLEELQVPTLVIGSRDEADPGHPLRVAEEYARRIPVSELVVEEPGKPPIAWRGAHLSRAIAAFATRHGAGPGHASSGCGSRSLSETGLSVSEIWAGISRTLVGSLSRTISCSIAACRFCSIFLLIQMPKTTIATAAVAAIGIMNSGFNRSRARKRLHVELVATPSGDIVEFRAARSFIDFAILSLRRCVGVLAYCERNVSLSAV